MASITAQENPTFKESIRKLASDDGGQPILDYVDIVTEALLNNTKAAYNKAVEGSNLLEFGSGGATTTQRVSQLHSVLGHGGFAIGSGHVVGSWGLNAASVGGSQNNIDAANSFIGGGWHNTIGPVPFVLHAGAAIIGGKYNNASGKDSGIFVGEHNLVESGIDNAAVIAGAYNESDDDGATVVGGVDNLASGLYSSLIAGASNICHGVYSVVAGGYNNLARPGSEYCGILGGRNNTLCWRAIFPFIGSTIDSAIAGGYGNEVRVSHAFTGGGLNGYIGPVSHRSAIIGGEGNRITQKKDSVILGGYENNADGSSGTIMSGWRNSISSVAAYAVIAGGFYNNTAAGGDYSFIGGGYSHTNDGDSSTILGGRYNTVRNNFNAVVGGEYNTANGWDTVIVGGYYNETVSNAAYAFIAGGKSNYINGNWSVIVGGRENYMLNGSTYNSIINCRYNIIQDGGSYNFVAGSSSNFVYGGNYNSIIGGFTNKCYGDYLFAGGAQLCTLTSGYGSAVILGYDCIMDADTSAIVAGYHSKCYAHYSFQGGGGGTTGHELFMYGNTVAALASWDTSIGTAADGAQKSVAIGIEGGYVRGIHNAIMGSKNSKINSASELPTTHCSIVGGYGNTIAHPGSPYQSLRSVIIGGSSNYVAGSDSAILSGVSNQIRPGASRSVVGGINARSLHSACFVWGGQDYPGTDFDSTADNQFLIKADAVGINLNNPSVDLHALGEIRSDASLEVKEVASSPTNVTDVGQIYTKSDNKLYFMDGDGNEYTVDLTAVP